MTDLTPGEKQDGLAYSQAACYAAMSAKEHREGSAQATQMLRLTVRLVDLALAAFDGAPADVTPVPGEPTLADIVARTKAAAAAGQPAPQVVVDLTQPASLSAAASIMGPLGGVAELAPRLSPTEYSGSPGVEIDLTEYPVVMSPEIEPLAPEPTSFDPVADYKPLPV